MIHIALHFIHNHEMILHIIETQSHVYNICTVETCQTEHASTLAKMTRFFRYRIWKCKFFDFEPYSVSAINPYPCLIKGGVHCIYDTPFSIWTRGFPIYILKSYCICMTYIVDGFFVTHFFPLCNRYKLLPSLHTARRAHVFSSMNITNQTWRKAYGKRAFLTILRKYRWHYRFITLKMVMWLVDRYVES